MPNLGKFPMQDFIKEATPQQKHTFLSKFINSVTVYPDKITIEYFLPVFKNQKSPGNKSQSFLVTALASPIPQSGICDSILTGVVPPGRRDVLGLKKRG